MKIEQIVCDECKRVRQEANHWLKIGLLKLDGGGVQLTIGVVPEKQLPGFEVHDVCGQQCFHKHIDYLLGTPIVEATPPPLPEPISIDEIRNAKTAEYTGV